MVEFMMALVPSLIGLVIGSAIGYLMAIMYNRALIKRHIAKLEAKHKANETAITKRYRNGY